ncbi:MAG: BON domain-containing protein [Fodinibius sp.]|nr:BON domain-containing protein [Fodinibius sp.]
MTNSLEKQLTTATNIPDDDITITTDGNVVTLSGTTSNLLAKQKATDMAQQTAGVISVVNNLRITASRPDKAVNSDVAQALATNPATENWDVNTKVNNGLVTLTGRVESWQEKQLVSTIVSGVKGVKEINNSLQVAINPNRSASDIKAEVKQAMMYDSRIRDNMISVDVSDGTVTLSGAVGSTTEKELAIKRSHVAGVQDVNAKNLTVKPEYDSKMLINETITSLSANEIENAITKAWSYDPRVPASELKVEVTKGTARLTGTVKNLGSKLAAENDVRHTAGIKTIHNDITVQRKVVVQPAVPTTDDAITNRIKNTIRRDPYVEEANLDVAVSEGIVTLSGNVNSKFEKQQVLEITQDIKGIIAINNNLKVQPQSGETAYQ